MHCKLLLLLSKPVPVTVTLVPPAKVPIEGVSEVTIRGVNHVKLTTPTVEYSTSTPFCDTPTCAVTLAVFEGVEQVNWRPLGRTLAGVVNTAPVVVLKRHVVEYAVLKLVPVTVSTVPPVEGPLDGVIPVTV
jgi:hypothetical protein